MDRNKDFLESAGAIALCRIFGYEPEVSLALYRNLGSCAAVFTMTQQELEDVFGPYSTHRSKIVPGVLEDAASELERMERDGYSFVGIWRDDYPPLLKECPDAPIGLYLRSCSDAGSIFRGKEMVSIVGTRDITPYGEEMCRRIVSSLSRCPARPTIVSGLAIGVDICAHMAALDAGIPTVAVSPVGIRDVYPARHRGAAARIAGSPSCGIVTDYPPHSSPIAVNFLRRNRIIAGMSRATILVESRTKGGGTMTARLAAGYGREVFCLPGRVDDACSQGCNLLVQEKLADVIANIEALPSLLGLGAPDAERRVRIADAVKEHYPEAPECETKDMCRLLEAVRDCRGLSPDELCRKLDLPYRDALRLSCSLESEGLLRMDLLQRCTIAAGIV